MRTRRFRGEALGYSMVLLGDRAAMGEVFI